MAMPVKGVVYEVQLWAGHCGQDRRAGAPALWVNGPGLRQLRGTLGHLGVPLELSAG